LSRWLLTTSLTALAELLGEGDVVALTGAGVSTDSGIPAYRELLQGALRAVSS
jgi:NAD-dependent SIR2 family protein deacetylase